MRNFDYRRKVRLIRERHERELRAAIFAEMTRLRRQLVARVRRLEADRPKGVVKVRLYKQSVISDSLWQAYRQRLMERIIPLLRSGAIDLIELNRLYSQRQGAPGMDSDVIADTLLSDLDRDDYFSVYADHLDGSVDNMRRTVTEAVLDWYHRPGATLADVVNGLSSVFSDSHAEMIAVTEMTDLNAKVHLAQFRAAGIERWSWQTMRDELVCIHHVDGPDGRGYNGCRELHGKIFTTGQTMMPKASHLRCRCFPSAVMPEPERIQPIQPVAPQRIETPIIQAPALEPPARRSYVSEMLREHFTNLPTTGRLADLASNAMQRLAEIEAERMSGDVRDAYRYLSSKDLEQRLQTFQSIMDRLRPQRFAAEHGGRPLSAEEEADYQNKLGRLKEISLEIKRRREWYDRARQLEALQQAQETGKVVLTRDEVTQLLSRPRDVYVDHGWTPDKGKPAYTPEWFLTSDLSGAKVRNYIILPDGRIAHPDEIHEAQTRGRLIVMDATKPIIRDWTKKE